MAIFNKGMEDETKGLVLEMLKNKIDKNTIMTLTNMGEEEIEQISKEIE